MLRIFPGLFWKDTGEDQVGPLESAAYRDRAWCARAFNPPAGLDRIVQKIAQEDAEVQVVHGNGGGQVDMGTQDDSIRADLGALGIEENIRHAVLAEPVMPGGDDPGMEFFCVLEGGPVVALLDHGLDV